MSSSRMRYDASDDEDFVEDLDMYLVVKSYSPGESIPTDYFRCGETPGRNVENVVDVSVRDYFFFRIFEYRETFRDEEGHKEFLSWLERAYPSWVDRLATSLEMHVEGVTKARASQSIEKIAGPWVEKISKDEPIEYQLLDEGLRRRFAKALMAEFSPEPRQGRDGSALVEGIEEAIHEAAQGFDREETEVILFGVYPLQLFSSRDYTIRQALSMPGTILETNASVRDGHTLGWEFKPDELLVVQAHVAEARSRVVFPLRIAGFVVILLVGALWARGLSAGS